jgi:hypothetical protein
VREVLRFELRAAEEKKLKNAHLRFGLDQPEERILVVSLSVVYGVQEKAAALHPQPRHLAQEEVL